MLPVGQSALDPSNEHLAAPIRATSVKRAYEPGPVTTRAAGLG